MAKSIKRNKRQILVAGGAGFAGSHLCEVLVARGNFVIALDNLSTGNKKNIAHLLSRPNFQFIKGDIVYHLATLPYLKRGREFDEVYHLASPASPSHYQKDPVGTWKANTIGTLNLLELASRYRAKFLFASTSEVYGDPLRHPQKENYFGNVNTIGVRSCYDESKRAGETLCVDFRRMRGVEAKIIRIFNTYGPNMDAGDGRVVSNFIVQALQNKPVIVYGKGLQTRSFQYVDDLIDGILKVMAKKNFYGPINLGNPGEFTIMELAERVIKLTGSKSKIAHKPLPPDDPKQRRPNIALAREVLGWEPKVVLSEGLKRTIAYFRGKLKIKA